MTNPRSKALVDRPAITASDVPELLAGRRERLRKLLLREPPKFENFGAIASAGEALITYASVVERGAPDLGHAARAIAQGNAGALVLGTGEKGREVEVEYGDKTFVVPSNGLVTDSSVGSWKDGWYGGLIARHDRSLDVLSGIPDEPLQLNHNHDDYHYAWKAALVAFRSSAESALPLVEEASALVEKATEAHPDAVALARATIPLLTHVVRNDAPGFNAALASALEAHRAMWGNPAEAHKNRGWVAWGPLALCCLAHDRGIPVEVESDYLLPNLIEAKG